MFNLGKKGISAVVATVLIILITVAAIVIVWMMILPTLFINPANFNVDARIEVVSVGTNTLYSPSNNLISINVKRYNDDSKMSDVKIILWDKGNTFSKVVEAPQQNQAIKYVFDLGRCNINPDSVSLAPIFLYEGSKVEGSSIEEIRIPRDLIKVNESRGSFC